jgi:hypothetical protein
MDVYTVWRGGGNCSAIVAVDGPASLNWDTCLIKTNTDILLPVAHSLYEFELELELLNILH